MEDWQVETLRYIWKKKKLDECITEDHWRGEISYSTRVYQFPNRIRVECKGSLQKRHYAEMKVFADISDEIAVFSRLNQKNTKTKKKGDFVEFKTLVISKKELMNYLWELYILDHPDPYGSDIPRDDLILCPRCKAVYSYDLQLEQMSVTCQNCSNVIALENPFKQQP